MFIPSDKNEFLWNNIGRLGGVEKPRVWAWDSGGLPDNRALCRDNLALLGQDWWFRSPAGVDALLSTVGNALALDRPTWAAQRPFLQQFVGSFFRSTDRPAWVKIHAIREGFSRRMRLAQFSDHCHRGSLDASDAISIGDLRSGRFSIFGGHLPSTPFRAYHPLGVEESELKLKRVWIHRTLRAAHGSRILRSTEERIIVVCDDEDIAMAKNGVTPGIEQFRDCEDVQISPLVSLSRFDEAGHVAYRCFSLCPLTGELADFRCGFYTTEYYFRSDMTTHTMLSALLVPGEYGAF